jgi:hypothetical protein
MKTIMWIPSSEKFSPWGEDVLILKDDGTVRTGHLDGLDFPFWRLTDCVDPIQNCHLSLTDTAWRND